VVKKIFLAVLLTLMTAGSCMAAEERLTDPEAEPADFRGLKWGQEMSTISDLVETYRQEDGSEVICKRNGDDLTYGAARLHAIEYVFIDGKLSRVSMIAKGEADEKALLDEAKAIYGDETLEMDGDYIWRFTEVRVMFSKEPSMGQSVLFYAYMPGA
jgi:hypothetical protein